MADLTIKPTGGASNKLILKDQQGGAVFSTSTSGATLEANTTVTGPLSSTVEFPTIMKRHITFNKNGQTKANYARSMDDILLKYPSSASGNYWIDPQERNQPALIACDTDGWMTVRCKNDANTSQSTGGAQRNLFLYSWQGWGSMIADQNYCGNTGNSGFHSGGDPNGIMRTAWWHCNEGFYTKSGNNSYNIDRRAILMDKTGLLGNNWQGPNFWHDVRWTFWASNTWGWGNMTFREAHTMSDEIEAPGTSPPMKDIQGYIGISNNSSNNGTYVSIYKGATSETFTSGSSPLSTGASVGTDIWCEKIAQAVRMGRASTPYTGSPNITCTTTRNWAGAFIVDGGQSPSGFEVRDIKVKSLFDGEL